MLNLKLKIPPLVVLLISGLLMWLINRPILQGSIHIPYSRIIAMAFCLIGAGFALAGVWQFRKAQTTVNPTKPNASTAIVSTGIYSISQNPMYVGFLCLLIGWWVGPSNVLGVVILPVYVLYMNYFQIRPEEELLTSKFGKVYLTYKQSVRRWL